jgi:hypothetical protein
MARPYVLPNRKAFADAVARLFLKYQTPAVTQEDKDVDLCLKRDSGARELLPHQRIVRDYLAAETPYRGLLLYHGLGSGKTCSAIGIAEDMRATMSQTSMKKQIMLVASTNVQDNFRLQLFDERKLKRALDGNGSWTIEAGSCIGNSLLKEINPMNDVGITAEKIISQANTIINNSYEFVGYTQLANHINKYKSTSESMSEEQREEIKIANIKRNFNFLFTTKKKKYQTK